MKDLFGQEIIDPVRVPVAYSDLKKSRKGKPTKASGYAYPPGSGPAGEFCRTCKFAVSVCGGARNFWKCELVRKGWTHGPGSDIRLKSPACSGWKKK